MQGLSDVHGKIDLEIGERASFICEILFAMVQNIHQDFIINPSCKKGASTGSSIAPFDLAFKIDDILLSNHKVFHSLGLSYDRTRIQSYPKTQVRALARIRHRNYDTGRREPSPVTDQRNLSRWAAWWYFDALTLSDKLKQWVNFTEHHGPVLVTVRRSVATSR